MFIRVAFESLNVETGEKLVTIFLAENCNCCCQERFVKYYTLQYFNILEEKSIIFEWSNLSYFLKFRAENSSGENSVFESVSLYVWFSSIFAFILTLSDSLFRWHTLVGRPKITSCRAQLLRSRVRQARVVASRRIAVREPASGPKARCLRARLSKARYQSERASKLAYLSIIPLEILERVWYHRSYPLGSVS